MNVVGLAQIVANLTPEQRDIFWLHAGFPKADERRRVIKAGLMAKPVDVALFLGVDANSMALPTAAAVKLFNELSTEYRYVGDYESDDEDDADEHRDYTGDTRHKLFYWEDINPWDPALVAVVKSLGLNKGDVLHNGEYVIRQAPSGIELMCETIITMEDEGLYEYRQVVTEAPAFSA